MPGSPITRIRLSNFASNVVNLTATGIATSAPSVGSPALTQAHSLTATGIAAGAPTVGEPALTSGASSVDLIADGIAGGIPDVGTPALTENGALPVMGGTDRRAWWRGYRPIRITRQRREEIIKEVAQEARQTTQPITAARVEAVVRETDPALLAALEAATIRFIAKTVNERLERERAERERQEAEQRAAIEAWQAEQARIEAERQEIERRFIEEQRRIAADEQDAEFLLLAA